MPKARGPALIGEERPGKPLAEFHLGIDFGVRHDFTTLVGLTRTQFWDWEDTDHFGRPRQKTRPDAFHVNILERYSTDTDNVDDVIPDVNRRIGLIRAQSPNAGIRVAADFTGVGDGPVKEMLKNNPHDAEILPVYFTAGAVENRKHEEGQNFHYYTVPRIKLLDIGQRGMRVGLGPKDDRKPVRISAQLRNDPLVSVLIREMRSVDIRMPTGLRADDDLAAWRENEHDDLVFALCMASWSADKGYQWPFVIDINWG
jgi:hypothetical protein